MKSSIIEGAPIVGVTGTYYPDLNDIRFEIALDTANQWKGLELPLVVVDGSPDNKVAGALRARGATVLAARQPGIASQRQEGAQYVRRTEELAGWVLERTLGLPADALAGPRGYNRQGMQHLLRYPSDRPGMNNWIYMYDNPLAARANGERVGDIQADLMYPEAQVEQETGNPAFDRKRYEQFALQLNYLLKRPEAEQQAADLRKMVLGSLALMSVKPTDAEIKDFFGVLEDKSRQFGYKN